MIRVLPAVVGLLVLAGCSTTARPFIKPGFQKPETVAILPFNNMTNSLRGATYVRFRLKERVIDKYDVEVLTFKATDAALRTIGISDGGQLNSATPQKIAALLGVEALLYTDLMEFGYTTTGFLNVKKCRARIRIVDGATGDLLYSAEGYGGESTTAVSGEGAAQAGAAALAGQVGEKAAGEPLAVPVQDMLDRLFEWLPNRD